MDLGFRKPLFYPLNYEGLYCTQIETNGLVAILKYLEKNKTTKRGENLGIIIKYSITLNDSFITIITYFFLFDKPYIEIYNDTILIL